jgi:putative sterol carrier protein
MMAYQFVSEEYLGAIIETLNNDLQYADIAKNWEGDLLFVVDPDEGIEDPRLPVILYLDLWHGACRGGRIYGAEEKDLPKAAFILTAPRSDFLRVLNGEMHPLQAMLTRKLRLQGSMAYMTRNVPVLLDFVRCLSNIPIAPDPLYESSD